jgi:laccase
MLPVASWFKGDVMAIIDEALTTGGDPNVSDAFTINGQPGDLYECSNGKYKEFNIYIYIYYNNIVTCACVEAIE